MDSELPCHPKFPGSNLVISYSFIHFPQMLYFQLPHTVITPTGEKLRISKFSQDCIDHSSLGRHYWINRYSSQKLLQCIVAEFGSESAPTSDSIGLWFKSQINHTFLQLFVFM